jgi:hypothetical protein
LLRLGAFAAAAQLVDARVDPGNERKGPGHNQKSDEDESDHP